MKTAAVQLSHSVNIASWTLQNLLWVPSSAPHPPIPPSCLMNQVWTVFKDVSWGEGSPGWQIKSKAWQCRLWCDNKKNLCKLSALFQSCSMNHSQGMFLRWREVTNVTEIENEAWHSVVVLATAQTTNLLLALAVLAHPCFVLDLRTHHDRVH